MIHHFKSIDSTNSLAFRMAEQGAVHGTVIHADRQSAGRGRGGRDFVSPAGGLYFSLIIRPELELNNLPLVSLAAGVGICRGVQVVKDVPIRLKWPNDLFLNGLKLGGILAESGPFRSDTGPDFIIIGVGINMYTDPGQFPSTLRTKVISLYHGSKNGNDGDLLLKSCSESVFSAVQELERDRERLLEDFRKLDFLKGRMLEFQNGDELIPATGIGLAEDGKYIIRDEEGKDYYILAGDLNPISI